LIGVAAFFVNALDGLVMWALDGLASLCFLAGGIALAVGVKGTNCSNPETFANSKIILSGWLGLHYDYNGKNAKKDLTNLWESRCRRADVDATFTFLALLISVALIAVGFMHHKKGGRSTSYV